MVFSGMFSGNCGSLFRYCNVILLERYCIIYFCDCSGRAGDTDLFSRGRLAEKMDKSALLFGILRVSSFDAAQCDFVDWTFDFSDSSFVLEEDSILWNAGGNLYIDICCADKRPFIQGPGSAATFPGERGNVGVANDNFGQCACQ